MSSRITFYLELTVWTIALSVAVLLGYWTLILPQITAVILAMIAVVGAIWSYVFFRDGINIILSPIDSSLGALWLGLLLAALLSTDPSRSWPMVWMWSVCIFVYYMSLSAFRKGWRIGTFVKGLLLVMGIALLAGYLQLYVWLQQWYVLTEWTVPLPPRLLRVWGLTNSPNVFVILLNMTMMLAIAYFFHLKKTMQMKSVSLLLLWFLAAVPMLIVPGSRSGWISASLGIMTLFVGGVWLTRRQTDFFSVRILIRLLSAILLICLTVAFLVIWRRPETLQLDFSNSVNYRLPFWRIALNSWLEHFWFGTGPNTYGTTYMLNVYVPFETAFMDAHSLFFNTVAEMGVVGLIVLLFLFSQLVRFVWQARQSSHWDFLTLGLLAALITFGGYCLFDTPETWVTLFAAVCLGALVARLQPVPFVSARNLQNNRFVVGLPIVGLWIFLLITGFIGWQANRAYTAGVTEAELDDWATAIAHFEQAQSWLPYADSGIAIAQGLGYGILATRNPNYLTRAEDVFSKALMAEPGWPFNHANLAAIYWEQGKKEEAIAVMQTAVALSPEAPILYLNLGLWYEAEGDTQAAQAAYHTLYSLARTPQEIDFWQETDTRQVVAASLVTDTQLTPYGSPGYIALNHNDPVTAVARFLEEIGANPNQTTAYLGLGIAYMQIGNEALAAQALHRARALDAGHATVRLYGSQQPYINLWQAVLDDNEPDRVLATIVEQSMLEYGNYSLTLFGRIDPPYDVTPQLHCFDRNPVIAAHFNWLYMLYKTQPTLSAIETATFELVDKLRKGNGIQPCRAVIR